MLPDQELERLAHDVLKAHPAGIDEHAFFRQLAARGRTDYDRHAFGSSHQMFKAHFRLFHSLYRLRAELRESGEGDLEIHAVCIRILPYVQGDSGLAHPDPIAAYYLDPSHLSETSAQDVDDMLDAFWKHLSSDQKRAKALQVLGLEEPVTKEEIRRRYRELALQHHPDQGGDTAKQRELNLAYEALTRGG